MTDFEKDMMRWGHLSTAQRTATLPELFRLWGSEQVISYLAQQHWETPEVFAKAITHLPGISRKQKDVRTVGVHFFHYEIGGVSKVLSYLFSLLQKMGYRILFITETPETPKDFPLPSFIKRCVLPNCYEVSPQDYPTRMHAWKDIIDKYEIDLVLDHASSSPLLMWDMMYLKSLDIPVAVEVHSIFSYPITTFEKELFKMPYVIALADAVIVLSEVDKLYWSAFNQNIHYIPNPVEDKLKHIRLPANRERSIVWVGRLAKEKRPDIALAILKEAVLLQPDIHMYIVGGGKDTALVKKYHNIAKQYGLSDHVTFVGPVQDVGPWLKKSSVHLMTSKYEGFPMVLVEAQAYGLPTVMFDMPFVELCKPERGTIGVSPNNITEAASSVVELLVNTEVWDTFSQCAQDSFQQLSHYDHASAWKSVISGESTSASTDETTKKLIRTIVDHYEAGWYYQREEGFLALPKSFIGRFWRAIYLLPQKIRGGIRCYQEHGMRYTLGRVKIKLIRLFLGKNMQ